MGTGKIELELAEKLAMSVINHIKPAMNRSEVAGSIRRKKDVVGDIEIVGLPGDRIRLIELLSDVGQHIKPGVTDIIPWQPKIDAKYMRVRLQEGINLDVFLAVPENFGGIYLMRTGSATGADGNAFSGFVPSMFGRWKKLSGGGRMTDCRPTLTTGEQLVLKEEQDFFDLLKMKFVPPQERVSKSVIKKYEI